MTTYDGIRAGATENSPSEYSSEPSWAARTWAGLFAARYDAQVEAGTRAVVGSPLAAHYARLASRRERDDMVRTLTLLVHDAHTATGESVVAPRAPIRADVVRESDAVIHDALARLAGPLPVRARGVARLRLLLGDGRGPLYRRGPGTFAAAIRGVLAAM